MDIEGLAKVIRRDSQCAPFSEVDCSHRESTEIAKSRDAASARRETEALQTGNNRSVVHQSAL